MLYEEWKSRYKNLKNFNTVLQRCPRFWPLAPPRGMNPGVYSLGISEDPPRYLSSKFDASVRSDCWDISIWKTLTQCDGNGNANANANVDDRGDYNSSPCTSYRRAKNKESAIVTQFHKLVSCGPQYICTSCCQTFFRHSDVKFDIQGLKSEMKRLCTLGHKSVEDKEWICQQCANSLKKNNLNKYLPFCQARLRWARHSHHICI